MRFACDADAEVFTLVLLLLACGCSGLLCYNGTLTSLRYGDDPLTTGRLLNDGGGELTRLRCSMTIKCEECCVLLNVIGFAAGLSCYNCSETHMENNHCAGTFGTGPSWFNNTRLRLATCTGDNAMCFVRSWSARAKHAWLVQRGCYKSAPDDPLPHAVRLPTRAMSCKRERYKDAEYKVCLCQADWCNSANSSLYSWLHVTAVAGIACILRRLSLMLY